MTYWWNKKGAQSIHSPFVYELYQKVLRKRTSDSPEIKQYIEELKNSKEAFEVKDFGAGSRVFKEGMKRPVAKIHSVSSSTPKKRGLLARIIQYYGMNNVLELGTCLGVGTYTMSEALRPKGTVYTIEGDPHLYSFTKKKLAHIEANNIESFQGTFSEIIDQQLNQFPTMDLIFLDGHHEGSATLKYISELRPLTHNQTMLILDDIYWNTSMKEAWKKLSQSEQFNVSIDLFDVGILIPRKEQRKEHFILNF